MTYTRVEAIEQTLDNLGKTGNGEVSDEDQQKVDKILDGVAADLSARDIFTLSDIGLRGPTGGAIETEVFLAFCNVLAWAAAPLFGLANDQSLLALALQAEDKMKIVGAPPRTLRVLKIEAGLRPQRRFGTYTGL